MRISEQTLQKEAASTGFRPEVLEKAIHILGLLQGFGSHPYLKGRLALKGGTALNLFLFELPRLSVDIDLNYVGSPDRAAMLSERPLVEKAITAVCGRQGFTINRVPDEHAGGKWRLRYPSAMGQEGNLELDLNYMLRVPLWPTVNRDSFPLGLFSATSIPILDLHELAAGKLAALLSRNAARDLFDVHQILSHGEFDSDKLRLAFVVYGAMNRKDWRTVSIDDIGFEEGELENLLVPVLRRERLAGMDRISTWAGSLVRECRKELEVVLPLRETEREFLERLLSHGEILPSLLTSDEEMQARIQNYPGLLWKTINVREFRSK